MATGFKILGRKIRSTIISYTTSQVKAWNWSGGLEDWSTDLISSVTAGEVLYTQCLIDGVDARIFIIASRISGDVIYGYNVAAVTSSGTYIMACGMDAYMADYNGVDFDYIFEQPFSVFAATTFMNYKRAGNSLSYMGNLVGSNINVLPYYKNNSYALNAQASGYVPANTNIATITSTGTWIEVKRAGEGISIGGTIYTNTSRGYVEHPLNRVGLCLCGAGGGGGGSYYRSATSSRPAISGGGSGGGGGGVAVCTLFLDQYTYYIYIGAGGSRGTGGSQSPTNGSNGGASYLRRDSSSGTLLVTCNGGNAGEKGYNSRGGGPVIGGSVSSSYSGTYFQLNGSSSGGDSGGGGYYHSATEEEEPVDNPAAAGNSCSGSGYLNNLSLSPELISWTSAGGAVYSYQTFKGNGGGGGASLYAGNASGYGGGGHGGLGYAASSYGYGQAGANGVAFFYY